jgi:hypothetical protein
MSVCVYTCVCVHVCPAQVLKQAGGTAQPTVFLFSDSQLKEESFLEDINNILNTGEVGLLLDQLISYFTT